jgi:integrative and conjugative element protein (TIGR02256 family)
MTFTLSGIVIILSETVLTLTSRYRQVDPGALEAGGILIGQISLDEKTVLISRASVPGPYDQATRATFRRDKTWAQGIVIHEFYNSGGKNAYLGEWHTHPSNRVKPSSQDEKMLKEQFEKNDIQIPFLFLLIIGLGENYLGLFDGKKLKQKLFIAR